MNVATKGLNTELFRQSTLPRSSSSAPLRRTSPEAPSQARQSIIHVPRRFAVQEWGGTETVVLESCRQQQATGWNPLIFTSKALAPAPSEQVREIPVQRFDYTYPYWGLSGDEKAALDKKGGNLLSLSLFKALLREPNVRLYHAHTLNRMGGMVRTAARLRRKPYVVTLHGGVFDVPQSERVSLLKPTQEKWEWGKAFGFLLGSRHVLEDADMVICVGAREAELAREALTHDRVAHLPNGVDCERFTKGDGAAFRAQHGIPQEAFVVLNISRVDAQKNQLLLLKSFARLASQRADAHLVILGPETQPEYAAQLRQLRGELGLEGKVHLLPGLKNQDPTLVDAYHACDVFVLPSLHEPFGIVVLEAWSAGKPVISSNVGGLSSLVRHNETGLVIEPEENNAPELLASKLLLLSRLRSLRSQLGQRGRQEATQRYDWSRVTQQLEDLYQQAEEHAASRLNRRSATR